MSKSKIIIFDEIGDKFEVFDIDSLKSELLDDDLEMLYKSSVYFNELEMAKNEIIDLGLMEQVKGEEYFPAPTLLGIKILGEEIVRRLGVDTLELYKSEIDLSWKENKPDMEKYRNAKK